MARPLVQSLILFCLTLRHSNGYEKVKILDETQFSNPLSFDYSFDDDNDKQVDKNDIYDELIPFLPGFNVHRNGIDLGFTQMPLVTRKSPTWSTQTTRPPYMKPYQGWHTTPMPRHVEPNNYGIGYNSVEATKQQSKTEIPITVDAKEELGQNLHFTKFAQRFGVNRVVSPIMEPEPAVTLPPLITTTTARMSSTTTRHTTPTPSYSNHQRSTTMRYAARRFLATAHDDMRNRGVKAGRSIQSRPSLKPLMIDTEEYQYQGPTFNCPVLTPKEDSKPSEKTDNSCKQKEPGVSADGHCRCTYEVTERDDNGCALGYIYTCLPK